MKHNKEQEYILDKIDHAEAIAWLARNEWGWPIKEFNQDARQEIAVSLISHFDFMGEVDDSCLRSIVSKALDKCAYDYGWRRVRSSEGKKKWIKDPPMIGLPPAIRNMSLARLAKAKINQEKNHAS